MQNILKEKCLLDSNILIYAMDEESDFHHVAAKILQACFEKDFTGFIAQQNIVECANVLLSNSKTQREKIIRNLETFANNTQVTVISPLHTTHGRFLELCNILKRRKKEFFDLYLVATMLDNEISYIITANDEDFKNIPGITVYNPYKKK